MTRELCSGGAAHARLRRVSQSMSQDVDWTHLCLSNWTSPPDHSPARLASAKAAVCSTHLR